MRRSHIFISGRWLIDFAEGCISKVNSPSSPLKPVNLWSNHPLRVFSSGLSRLPEEWKGAIPLLSRDLTQTTRVRCVCVSVSPAPRARVRRNACSLMNPTGGEGQGRWREGFRVAACCVMAAQGL